MYELKGTEAEVLVPAPRVGAVAAASTAVWRKVEAFCWEDGDEGYDVAPDLVGVYVAGQGLRRSHVVLNGR
jgi:hypothetical protein